MTTKNRWHGVFTALATPFENGEVDETSFVKLVRQQLDQGVQGFVINGTTAESPTLRLAEVHTLFELAKSEVAGQVPILVGTGSNSTAATCELSRAVSQWQPDGLLVVVPYYNRPPQRGLEQHFAAVACAAEVPIVLYNVPSRTVTSLEVKTAATLSRAKNILGLKDATGGMQELVALKEAVSAEFVLYSGDDATCVEFCRRGGHGVISVCSHIIGREMTEHLRSLNPAEFTSKYSQLMKWLYIESNPIPLKMAMHWMGIFTSPELRLPLSALDPQFHEEFKTCLRLLGKI